PFIGGPTEPVELFSSDGPRRIFFKPDGAPITPGKFLFANGGGELLTKPDITAADGTATATPGFNPFFGTSAAAPHAAGIAALLKSARPNASAARFRSALTRTALDIEARRTDRDAGFGIIDAFGALQFIGAAPMPFLDLGTVTTTVTGGDGDQFLEPGEGASLSVQLANTGGATALGVNATLTTSTPGVTITSATSAYPNIGSNGATAANNTPFRLSLAADVPCGLPVDLSLNVTFTNGENSPQTFTFTLPTGQPGSSTTFSYAGPPVAIPDSSVNGVNIPLTVGGAGSIADINFSFDGNSCTAVEGATSVGLDHTFVGDLVVTLTSPQGTTITLMNQPGGPLNGGNNFCSTVFDDEGGGPSIQTILSDGVPPLGPPYSGTFSPFNPLTAFKGENPNGTWILNVSDRAALDTGTVRAFSLVIASLSCN
ncbi:MAG: proprotein convertase P-domain-containing protein, partial [Pyrinomonadaceae bacterium]